jgi:CRP-like cAMP-binding protein
LHTRRATGHRFVPAGAELYCEGGEGGEGGDLYVVIEGWMMQYQILSDGRRQILDFALPGTILGLVSASDPMLTHTAESLTGATVAVIPRQRLEASKRSGIRGSPDIGRRRAAQPRLREHHRHRPA